MHMFLIDLIFKPIRWVLSLIFTALLLVIVAIALAGFYVPFLAEKFITYRSDYALSIDQSHMNLFFGEIDFWDTVLANPKRFQEPILCKIKECSVHASPLGLVKPIKVIDRLALDVPEVNWVKAANGDVNIDEFMQSFQSAKSSEKKEAVKTDNQSVKSSATDQSVPFLIKSFVLKIGKVRRIDYSQSKVKMTEYPVNIQLELSDVQSVNDILGPLSVALAKSSVNFLSEALVEGLPVDLKEASKGVVEGSSSLLDKASGALKSFF
jgi:hypothetical protein